MGEKNYFPVENSTTPYWRTELHEIDSYRSTEKLPEECDVLIIGAGLSGVSTAYHLLNDNPSPPSIVLLEAREVCSGATGRNGGHLMMVHSYIEKVKRLYGVDTARELAKFQASQVYAMKAVAQKEDLRCDAVLTRCLEVFIKQAHADQQKEVYEDELKEGLDFIDDVQYLDQKHVEMLSGVKGDKGAISTTALQLWPYKFVSGLLSKLIKRNSINVQTHTCVTSVSSHGGYSFVETSRGTIKAGKATPKESVNPPPHLSHTYGLNFDGPAVRDYLIPRPDGGVICGGGKVTYIKDTKLWFDNVDDSTLLEQARPHFESVMQENFRGWEKSGASVDHLWTGIIGYTIDGWPHCGKVPDQGNHFILAGYNGAGMPLIFLTAKGIARMIMDDVPFEESGIPRIFKTTQERLQKDVSPG